jgi:hypothetical protein
MRREWSLRSWGSFAKRSRSRMELSTSCSNLRNGSLVGSSAPLCFLKSTMGLGKGFGDNLSLADFVQRLIPERIQATFRALAEDHRSGLEVWTLMWMASEMGTRETPRGKCVS